MSILSIYDIENDIDEININVVINIIFSKSSLVRSNDVDIDDIDDIVFDINDIGESGIFIIQVHVFVVIHNFLSWN